MSDLIAGDGQSEISLNPVFYEILLRKYASSTHFFVIYREQKSNPYELVNDDDLIASENIGLEIYDSEFMPITLDTTENLIQIKIKKKLSKKIENLYNKMFCSYYNANSNLWVSNGMMYVREDSNMFYCNSTVLGEYALNVRNLEELFGYKRVLLIS